MHETTNDKTNKNKFTAIKNLNATKVFHYPVYPESFWVERNSLPSHLRKAASVNGFKRLYKWTIFLNV